MKLVFAFISLILSSSLFASASNDSKPKFELIRRFQVGPSWYEERINHETGERVRLIITGPEIFSVEGDGSYSSFRTNYDYTWGIDTTHEYEYVGDFYQQRKKDGAIKRERDEKRKEKERLQNSPEERCECEQEKQKTRFSFDPTSF